jgi:hypothetical protein
MWPERIGIFGSCVTRDLFEEPALRSALSQYTSRSSVISAVAEPVALDPALVRLDSAFQRRCVLEDFGKTFFTQLAASGSEWLLVDLIDERFEVLATEGSWVTRSSAFIGAGLDATLGNASEPVRRLTAEADALLAAAVTVFADRVTAVIAPERVIVHRAGWLTRYRDGGDVFSFGDARVDFAERHNAALDRAYDHLETSLGTAASIALDRTPYTSDVAHRWDLEPYHYEPAYNEAALDRLRSIVKT